MTRRQRQPVEASQSWLCALCDDHPEFDGSGGLLVHFRQHHPERLAPDGRLMATRRPTAFLDGQGFAIQQEVWEQDGVIIANAAHTIPRGRGEWQ